MPPGVSRAARVDALFEVRAFPVQHAEPVANPEARPYSLFDVDRCQGTARSSPRCGPPDADPHMSLLQRFPILVAGRRGVRAPEVRQRLTAVPGGQSRRDP